ncbi:hypothetical protein H5S09_02840 [Limosilactobacillus sp. STM2_1]|uniref:Uncharacterized protein n=1 Tax=Limosilactobacillus rudii TaxID=2759755 RepID=A0A7W3YN27_9LACO|nr:hypothetical protein [Limosilactobacillus rudii]MBB1080209.1 hypothetical protein [Limosilactobacillus rudii]MBB1096887.1 hypothetical protein [Limosilactobacillus rudii]MCD7133785.1 hypothetical protein [Limosilactobacillus rudii]
MNKQKQLHEAIQNVTHHAWDAILVLAGDKTSDEELIAGDGTVLEQAALVADFLSKHKEIATLVSKFLVMEGLNND